MIRVQNNVYRLRDDWLWGFLGSAQAGHSRLAHIGSQSAIMETLQEIVNIRMRRIMALNMNRRLVEAFFPLPSSLSRSSTERRSIVLHIVAAAQ